MRAIQVTPSFGTERCARELFLHLPSAGVESAMWVARRESHDPPGVLAIRSPWEKLSYPLGRLPWVADWRFFSSNAFLSRFGPASLDTVVHLHTVFDWLSMRALARLCQRVPVVWTLHDERAVTGGGVCDLARVVGEDEARRLTALAGPGGTPYADTPRTRRMARFFQRHLPRPAVVVCPTRSIVDLVQASGLFSHSQVVESLHGITMLDRPEATADRAAMRRALGWPADGHVVLMVGSGWQWPHKGAHLARAALELTGPLPLTVVVYGPQSELVQARGPGLKVLTQGRADDATLAMAYRAADVTLLPSMAESMSYVILESLACQTPVVAFAVGGPRQIVQESGGGLLAQPFEVRQLRDHMDRLLQDRPAREAMGQRGRQWVQEHAAMPVYLRRMVGFYELALRQFQSG